MKKSDFKLASWIDKNHGGALICQLQEDFIRALNEEERGAAFIRHRDNIPSFIKDHLESVIKNVLYDAGLYDQIIMDNETLSRRVGLPVLFTNIEKAREGYHTVVLNYLISSINAGKVTVNVEYAFKLGDLYFLPKVYIDTTNLGRVKGPKDAGKAAKVTRHFERYSPQMQERMKDAVKRNVVGHYVPQSHFMESIRHFIKHECIKYRGV